MPTDDRTASEWVAAFAARLGVEPPDDETVTTLLELAGVAAHASERTAAPVACWLVGRAGLSPAEALALARRDLQRRPEHASAISAVEVGLAAGAELVAHAQADGEAEVLELPHVGLERQPLPARPRRPGRRPGSPASARSAATWLAVQGPWLLARSSRSSRRSISARSSVVSTASAASSAPRIGLVDHVEPDPVQVEVGRAPQVGDQRRRGRRSRRPARRRR